MIALKNAWYMAGWSEEIIPRKLIERTITGTSYVFFRDREGAARALLNRCPHRFAPLHLGQVLEDGNIRCAYHGLEFDSTGECVRNPHGGGTRLAAAKVLSFPVIERHGMVWMWPGDPSLLSETLLPDFREVAPERSFIATRFLTVNCNYVLESDNILDLSHIQFLHPTTLGSDAVARAEVRVEQTGNTILCSRFVQGEMLPPFLEKNFSIPPGTPADRWLDVRWDPPASLLLTISIGISGAGRENARCILMPHIFTPATASTTHYWFASCFNREAYPDGAERSQQHVEGLTRPFMTEDLPMLEAQQRSIGDADFWSLNPVLLRSDAAAVKARRILDSLIKLEHPTTEEHR